MLQTIRMAKGPIKAHISLPGSKSMTYRALLLTALADGVSEITGMHLSARTRAFIHAMSQLGIVFQLDETSKSCIIAGCNGSLPKKQVTVWCDGLASVIHFLFAICAASPGVYYFDGGINERKKSLEKLLNLLRLHGVQFIPSDTTHLPLSLVGADSLEGGEIILDQRLSSQMISALLMIAPFARSPLIFTLKGMTNLAYIDMTCAMMADFGVLVHRIHQNQLMVPVPQRYQAKDYVIEPDLSIAVYFFAAAAVTGGEVTVQSIKRNTSKQLQIKFLSILEKMGCRIIDAKSTLTLKAPNELEGIEVSMRDFTDSFLALAAIAPFAKSPTRISHIDTMKQKEIHYLTIIKTEFIKLGIHIETGKDWIKIFPSIPQGKLNLALDDPHIAMAFSVIGLKITGMTIDDACMSDLYPDFFKDWHQMTNSIHTPV